MQHKLMLSSYNRTQKTMYQSHNVDAEGGQNYTHSIRATSFALTTTASPLIIILLYLKETFLVINKLMLYSYNRTQKKRSQSHNVDAEGPGTILILLGLRALLSLRQLPHS